MTATKEYFAKFPPEANKKLLELRDLILQTLPEVTESLKWGNPAYSTGTILVAFSGFKQYVNLYLTPSAIAAFADALKDFKTGQMSVRLAYDEPLPEALIIKMLKYRRTEYAEHGVGWR